MKKLNIVLFLVFVASISEAVGNAYDDNISFSVYLASGSRVKYGDSDTLSSLGCDPSGLWAMVVHGWKNGPSTSSWIPDLTKNLNKYRGGCVIVIDFFYYSSSISYFVLVRNFPGISAVLLKKLNQMFKEGFKASNGYIFGFSLGAQLVIDVGMKLNGTVDRIDVCEPAGPGFDNDNEEPKLAGKNVQCIHTSIDLGTKSRKCHQDWLMGNCGTSQPAAGTYTNHGLCPHFYNSAFVNDFLAESNPLKCTSNIGTVAKTFPSKYKMGYMETRQSEVTGHYFQGLTKQLNITSKTIYAF